MTLRELLVSIGIDADTDAVEAFDDAIGTAKGHLEDLAGVATAAIGAIAALTGALVYQASATAGFAEEVTEQAAALGITTDAYQELAYAASRYGIDSEKITTILSKLAVDQKAVAEGNKDAAATYAALGLSVEQVAAAKPEQLLALMADGFATLEDDTTRLATASALFGDRIASKLIPLLSGGSDGLAAMAAEAHALGLIMSEEAIGQANAFNDQLEVMGAVVESLRNEIGLAMIPVLTRLAGDLLAWVATNRDLINTKIEEWAERVSDAFLAAADALDRVNTAVGGVEGWERLVKLLAVLGGAAGAAYVAVKFVLLASAIVDATMAAAALVGGLGILSTVVAFIAAAIAQMIVLLVQLGTPILIIEDLVTYLQGGDSVFGRLLDKFRDAPGILGSVVRLLEALGLAGRAAFDLMGIAWDAFVGTFMVKAGPMLAVVEEIGMAITTYIEGAIASLIPWIDRAAAAINGIAAALGSPTAQAQAVTAGVTAGMGANQSLSTFANAATTGEWATRAGTGAAPNAGKSISVGGDTITISGTGLSGDEVAALVDRILATKARATAETFRSAEV